MGLVRDAEREGQATMLLGADEAKALADLHPDFRLAATVWVKELVPGGELSQPGGASMTLHGPSYLISIVRMSRQRSRGYRFDSALGSVATVRKALRYLSFNLPALEALWSFNPEAALAECWNAVDDARELLMRQPPWSGRWR